MNEDGRMARLNDLKKFSQKHKIKIASIEDLIAYRLRNEKLIYKSINKQISFNKNKIFDYFIYKNKLNKYDSFVIRKGKINPGKVTRVRVISTVIKNSRQILKNKKIKKSIQYLSNFSSFALIVINNENRKIKLEKDIFTLRYYGIGAQIIKDLKVKNMILVTRTKKKLIGLEGFGLKIKRQEILK